MGSVVALSDSAGSVVEQYSYSPFGQSDDISTVGNPLRYTARYWDEDAQLYYNRARYYSPELRRFIQADPLGYADGLNIYAYVGNDPLNFVDPLGLYGQGAQTNAGNERTWGSYLPGTEAGDRAATYWADRVVSSEWHEDPAARAGLFFSVLWTDDTAASTALTLGTGGLSSLGMRLTRSGWLRFGKHDKTGGISIGLGRSNARIDIGRLPNQGKAAERLPTWSRGRVVPHYHRRGAGGISRHRPWQETPGVPKWKFWERF